MVQDIAGLGSVVAAVWQFGVWLEHAPWRHGWPAEQISSEVQGKIYLPGHVREARAGLTAVHLQHLTKLWASGLTQAVGADSYRVVNEATVTNV